MPPKLYIERRAGLRRVPFWASPETTLTLLTLRDHYATLVGRQVSTTIIIRRALDALSKGLPKAKPDAEMAALMRHVR